MRFGFFMPIFGGWLRNVEEEGMPATFDYVKEVAQTAEHLGYDVTLLSEHYLNDIKGPEADALEAWTTAAALCAVTNRLEIMAALRPVFHNPAVTAKMAANLDHISGGRFTMNIVSACRAEEERQYHGMLAGNEQRYALSQEFVDVMKGLWLADSFTYEGAFYHVQNAKLAPKPKRTGTMLYAGAESERGKRFVAESCDAYLMHGKTAAEAAESIAQMKQRRQETGLAPLGSFGMAAYVIVRDTREEAEWERDRIMRVKPSSRPMGGTKGTQTSRLEEKILLEDDSVSEGGLRPHLVGTPEDVAEGILEFETAGVDLILLQCSPQLEELERFSRQVMPLVAAGTRSAVAL